MSTNTLFQSWIRLAVFNRPSSAKALQAFLEEESFVARVRDERKLQRYWFLTKPRGGIYVEIPEDSLMAVKNCLVQKEEGDALLRDAIRCPSCQSLRVEYPQMTRKNILPTLVAHSLVLLHLMEPEFYCEDCHYTWSTRNRRTRIKSEKTHRSLESAGTIARGLSHANQESKARGGVSLKPEPFL
jgi:transposase-like protein